MWKFLKYGVGTFFAFLGILSTVLDLNDRKDVIVGWILPYLPTNPYTLIVPAASVAYLLWVSWPWLKQRLAKKPTRVMSQTFHNCHVTLDGKTFHQCTFENVTFKWDGGFYFMFDCKINGTRNFETGNGSFVDLIDTLKRLDGFLDKDFAASWRHIER